MTDIINHPPHYQGAGMEVIDVIERFSLGFHLGNVVKYILRAGRKDDASQDLRKAGWYLNREISRIGSEERGDKADLTGYSLVYLATPYTKYKGGDINRAFVEASALAASLLALGIKVYSPIAHTHPLAIHGNLDPLDHSIWLPFDQAMMEAADACVVATMDGWNESRGVLHEIEWFTKAGKPVLYLDPWSMKITDVAP